MKNNKNKSIHVSHHVNVISSQKERNRYVLWTVRILCFLFYVRGIHITLMEYVKYDFRSIWTEELHYAAVIGAVICLAVVLMVMFRTVVMGKTLCLDLAGAGAVLGELIVETSFKGTGVFLIVGSSLILHAMKNKKIWYTDTILLKNGLWAAVIIITVSWAGKMAASHTASDMGAVHKYVWNAVNRVEKNITEELYKNNFHVPKWADAGTYISTEEGSISHESIERKDKTDLVVTLSERPHGQVYCRGFVGDTYEGTYWKKTDEKSFEAFFDEGTNGADMSNIMTRYISIKGAPMDQTVRIERVHSDAAYAYIPYGFQTPEDQGQKADGPYESQDTENKFQGCINWNEWIGEGPGEKAESEIEEKYREYVAEQYLKVPIYGLERLESYCDGYDFETAQEVIDFVIADVKKGREYCLAVDKNTQGTDIVEKFLFDEKKGFCVHYASAAVLMMRMMGVPARYVTGYVVFPEQFKEADGVYTANIPNEQAHAWIEVYRNGKGWIPMEVTPGYDTAPENMPEEQKGEIPMPTQQQNDPEEQMQPENNVEDKKEENNEKNEVIDNPASTHLYGKFIGWILAVAAVPVLCVFWRCIRCSTRKRKYYQRNRKEAVKELSYDIYQMICDSGMEIQNHSDQEFAIQAEKGIKVLETREYIEFMKIVERASFGAEEIRKEEWKEGIHIYKKLSVYFYEHMGLIKKFWWKYIKGYLLS